MVEITLALVREIDRRMAGFEKDIALDRQSNQHQIDDIIERLEALEKRKPRARFQLKELAPFLLPFLIFLSLIIANVPVKEAAINAFKTSKTASGSR